MEASVDLTVRPLFTFRLVVAFDTTYSTWYGRCLETGSIVTADDPKTAESMIKELLQDEAHYNLNNKTLANLFSSPAPFKEWELWRNTACRVEHIPGLAELYIVIYPNPR